MDGNQVVEGAPVVAAPPVNEYLNKYEEEKRKREKMESELNTLREQQLRLMAAPPQYTPPQAPEPEDEDIASMDPAQRRAIDKMMAKKESEIRKFTEKTARKTFYKESIKAQAMTIYPDLKNPQSDFFKKVAFFMDTHPGKYNDPEGILDACARISYEMKLNPSPSARTANEVVRAAVSSGSASVEGSGQTVSSDVPELDFKGQQLAGKLGIDPKKMAERLKSMSEGKGVYADREGKTGKAAL
jgi:hypothetical protein